MRRSRPIRRLRGRVERRLLGAFMGAVAFLIERRLIKRRES